MRITRIAAYKVELPLVEGSYQWAAGPPVSVFDSTVVRVETDAGIVGYGEACPLGSAYLPAYAAGVRAGIGELAPRLLGQDPTRLEQLNQRMDALLKGHQYAKSALDMACWDLLGKTAGLPVCALLGGRYGDDYPLYRVISQEAPDEMAARVAEHRAAGYRRFQLKVGGDANEDIERIREAFDRLDRGDLLIADANGGWLMHEAVRVIRGVVDVDVYIEQPCASYQECLSVRRRTDMPVVLDESIDSVAALLRAHGDRAMDVVSLQISRFGGLTRVRQARDLCATLGIAVIIEDSWGGDIATAAISHLAHSTPPDVLFAGADFNSYVTVRNADGAPQGENGRMSSSSRPGLGVKPLPQVLGEPLIDVATPGSRRS